MTCWHFSFISSDNLALAAYFIVCFNIINWGGGIFLEIILSCRKKFNFVTHFLFISFGYYLVDNEIRALTISVVLWYHLLMSSRPHSLIIPSSPFILRFFSCRFFPIPITIDVVILPRLFYVFTRIIPFGYIRFLSFFFLALSVISLEFILRKTFWVIVALIPMTVVCVNIQNRSNRHLFTYRRSGFILVLCFYVEFGRIKRAMERKNVKKKSEIKKNEKQMNQLFVLRGIWNALSSHWP